MLAAAAAALSPASSSSLRFVPHSAARFLSIYNTTTINPRITISTFKTLTHQFPPFLPLVTTCIINKTNQRRCFCSVSSSSETAIEKLEPELVEIKNPGTTEKVREFRKRLKIADVKSGPDEGLDRLGQKLVVKGWVRTLRFQSSVTFLEVAMPRDYANESSKNMDSPFRDNLVITSARSLKTGDFIRFYRGVICFVNSSKINVMKKRTAVTLRLLRVHSHRYSNVILSLDTTVYVKGLMDLIIQRAANMMKVKSPEEIRNENPWAFEIPAAAEIHQQPPPSEEHNDQDITKVLEEKI